LVQVKKQRHEQLPLHAVAFPRPSLCFSLQYIATAAASPFPLYLHSVLVFRFCIPMIPFPLVQVKKQQHDQLTLHAFALPCLFLCFLLQYRSTPAASPPFLF
jgi:hypothetical protein